MTAKYPTALLMFVNMEICHQHTMHYHKSHSISYSYLEPSKKLNLGQPKHLSLPNIENSCLSSCSTAFGIFYLPISCNGHMSTELLDSGGNYKFVALYQLKQFAPITVDWQLAKPLQVKLTGKSTLSSRRLLQFLCNLHLELLH